MEKKTFAVMDFIMGSNIKTIRKSMNLTQQEFSELINTSKKTIERWESSDKKITGPVVPLLKLLREYPQTVENLRIPEKKYPMRLWYMFENQISTIIDIDERNRKLCVYNYTNNPILRAFGREEKPTYEEYEEFLKSRCFPESRDKMKLILRDMDLPFYDPLLIIEKTEGRMAEDDCWIRIER